MPRRNNISPELDAKTKDWVRALLRVEMTEKKITYKQLVDLLRFAGLEEKEINLRNKITRGELSAANLLLCLKVMGTRTVNLERWVLSTETDWNIDRALADDLVKVLDRDDQAGLYTLLIGEIATPVTITLERRSSSNATAYTVSHAIKTPALAEPHRANVQSDANPERALRRAIRGLTSYYRLAVDAGHSPSGDWLIPTEELGPKPKYDAVGHRIS
ncbi:MAG: hypothetical protein J0G99_08445 [Alphaproteobacteria bacterium]|nr:hypothetical protein [Alphaproteobacteria bacterium]